MVVFDPTISLGSVLTAGGVVAGGVGFIWALKVEIRVLMERHALSAKAQDARLELVEKRLGDVTTVLERVARQDERLNYIEKRIDELAHGESFVLPIRKSPYER